MLRMFRMVSAEVRRRGVVEARRVGGAMVGFVNALIVDWHWRHAEPVTTLERSFWVPRHPVSELGGDLCWGDEGWGPADCLEVTFVATMELTSG
jgi:hypothetical protein